MNEVCTSSPPLPSVTNAIVQMEHAVNAATALRSFGLENLAQKFLWAGSIHDLGNTLSLSPDVRAKFSNLDLWFEDTEKVHHL